MNLEAFWQWVVEWPLSQWIQESSIAFPLIEIIHVLSIVTVVGTIAIVDLRLLGVPAHRRNLRELIAELLPFTWVAFILAVTSGALLFISKAPDYAGNFAFRMKLLLIALAGLNMLWFHFVTQRNMANWENDAVPPREARIGGGISLLLWILVIACGRWIGFTLY